MVFDEQQSILKTLRKALRGGDVIDKSYAG